MTAQVPALAAQAASRSLLQTVLDALHEAAWVVEGASRRVLLANAQALALLGRDAGEVIGADTLALLATPEDLAFWDEAAAGHGAPPSLSSHTRLQRADGAALALARRITPLTGFGAGPLFLVTVTDLTAARAAADERELLLAELRATLESTVDGILVCDLAGRIRAFNRNFARLWSLPEALLQQGEDRAVFDWMRRSVADADAYERRLATLRDAALVQATDRLTLLSGAVIERVAAPQLVQGRPVGRVYAFRDLSDQIATGQRIERLASTDALTGLANRGHFTTLLQEALSHGPHGPRPLALLVLDLDRFRQLNDSLGPAEGDRVLRQLGQLLARCLRQGDVVARVGGDQFALLIHDADGAGAEAGARRLMDAITAPFTIAGRTVTLTCSIGIALHPKDGRAPAELLRHAEAAMLQAKQAGRAGWRFHRHEARALTHSALDLDQAMRRGLAGDEFRLHYQPQVRLADDQVVGVEALLRWHDRRLGPVSPATFIPVAEDSGFILTLGDWVLQEAVRQAADWLRRGLRMPVAVNVAALQFAQPGFADRVAQVLHQHALPAALLELELTESGLVGETGEALPRLQALADLGVRLAIDDFGTGYSNLGYLKRLPIQKLKIDRGFVRGLPADGSDAGIVSAVLQMARALHLRVVAEGVETAAQRDFLARAGCDHYQGFLHAPALPAEQIEQRLLPATALQRA
ncbi:putative bifunctional diguanylate cyclase/phosphodiesterase [Aquabacterium sp. J223]|uniref:putative bifunctional diguanylate cyclase/phosphodiesterase n=1 Tax=Aquabacterium sp. J223 TaxID=2898431 RepID=UPI0021AE1870|nr:bifunctional diguanylate cyclase/phosphodiesterase [Aquabacterium sp. J223]UUX95981.1 EAL domain-containing protein [Aquabacterium sp. J223]